MLSPIEVTEDGIVIFFNEEHLEKEEYLNEVKDDGYWNEISFKDEHSKKELLPIEVTNDGIVILFKELHF